MNRKIKKLEAEILSILEERELSTREIHLRLIARGIKISPMKLAFFIKQYLLYKYVRRRKHKDHYYYSKLDNLG